MGESERIVKNNMIKEKGKETRLRHASMRPFVVEMKLDLKCLNKTEQEKLWHYFTECRWLCNYLISLDADSFRTFNTMTREITSLDRTAMLSNASLPCLPSSSSRCIRLSSRIWHPLQKSARRQERRTQ